MAPLRIIIFAFCLFAFCNNPIKTVQPNVEKGIQYNLLSDTTGYQWIKISWISGSNVCCFAQNSDRWYIGTDHGELLSSNDSGSTWSKKISISDVSIRSIAFVYDTVFFAAYGFYEIGNQGIYRSRDNCSSFQRITIPDDNFRPMKITARKDTVFAAWGVGWLANHSEAGCVRATYNAGQTWQKINNLSPSGFYSLFIKNGYLLASTDGISGNSIYKMNFDGSQSVDVHDEQSIAGATDFDTLGDTIFSTNSGVSINQSLDNGNSWVSKTGFDSTGYVEGIIISDGVILFGSSAKGIMISRDGADSFSQFNTSFNQVLPKVNSFFKAGYHIYCITDSAGIFMLISFCSGKERS
jgi:photosystem II stability/assembly factor-like uncharacterized protein